MHPDLGEFIYSMPPQQIIVSRWYRGTADSIYQNLTLLEQERPNQVLILSGDHVYKMNYREMLDFHLSRDADMTVAAVPVPRAGGQFLRHPQGGRPGRAVENFLEKPAEPPGMPGYPDYSLASMGVYVFRAEVLVEEVIKDAKKTGQQPRFRRGHHPPDGGAQKGLCLQLRRRRRPPRYWRDIGLLDAYFQGPSGPAGRRPHLRRSLMPTGPCAAAPQHFPPSNYIPLPAPAWRVDDSLIASGCVIEGTVNRSVLSPGVKVGRGAEVEEAILWDGVEIGAGATVKRAIIEDGVKVPPDFHIGARPPARRPALPPSPKTASSWSPTTSCWKSSSLLYTPLIS